MYSPDHLVSDCVSLMEREDNLHPRVLFAGLSEAIDGRVSTFCGSTPLPFYALKSL